MFHSGVPGTNNNKIIKAMAEENSASNYRDMLDIIFQNRNKAYGAYQLRRSYNEYLMRGFFFGLSFLILLFLLPRLVKAVSGALAAKPVEVEIEMGAPPDLSTDVPPPPPPPPPTPPPPNPTKVKFVPTIIKKD
jgi:protein TonB